MALSKKTKERIHRNKFYRSFYASLKTRDRKVIDEHFKRTYGTFGEVIFPTLVYSSAETLDPIGKLCRDDIVEQIRDTAYRLYRESGYKDVAGEIAHESEAQSS